MAKTNKEKIKFYLANKGVKEYQRQIFKQFEKIISTPSVDFDASMHIERDRRSQIKKDIEGIRKKYGLGVAILVLHAQQFISGHIPLQIKGENLAKPTKTKRGKKDELFLYVPLRKYRNNKEVLKDLGILYKYADEEKYKTHETDKNSCFYCSCNEMYPNEVVIDHKIKKKNSNNYKIGFTFAPWGRPDRVVHFLAWNAPQKNGSVPDMTFNSDTYADLVQFVIEINESIHRYFGRKRIKDFPIIDGVHNGWGGNTLYHNHFQFVCMENKIPILGRCAYRTKRMAIKNSTVYISKIDWPVPIYRIKGQPLLHKEAGTQIGIEWQSSSDFKCLYKEFDRLVYPRETDYVPVHAANIFIPGKEMGKVGYFVLRDCRRVDAKKVRAGIPPKKNLAVLESLGSFIIDDESLFKKISDASEKDRSLIATSWLTDITPNESCFFLETL